MEFCNLFDRTAGQDGRFSPCIVEPVLNLFQTCFCPLSFVGGAYFWACFLLCGPVLGRLSLLRTCFKPVLCGGGLLLGLLSPVWACSGPAFSSENLFQTCFGPLFPMRDYSALKNRIAEQYRREGCLMKSVRGGGGGDYF